MSKRFALSFSLAIILLLCSSPAMARNAELLLSPTRIVLENGAKYMTVTVRNNGDGVGRYKIELVDAVMNENGGIKLREEGSKDEFSAKDVISLSPRNMTLKPDENQVVRILVKNTSELPDGEYRSHLQVRMTENDLDLKTGKPSTDGTGVVVRPKMTTVIPLIVRKGTTEFKITLDDAKLVMAGGEGQPSPEIKASFSFSGNRSVLGDIKVTHVAPDGKETQLAFYRGIAIYRGLTKRTQTVPLKVPQGANIHSGKIDIAFMSQEDEGSKVLSSKTINP
ncbi:MAG TPA: hypothetical protein DCY07_08925 [Rhodospirillaceae bacterium]|nr:hypothetical protein [Rhodospirillaceae bacterium]